MLNEDDLRPGDVIQDAMGDFWHVHDDGKIWCSEPGARISFEHARSAGPFKYAPGADSLLYRAERAERERDEWEGKALRYSDKFNRARSFNVEMKARAEVAERERDAAMKAHEELIQSAGEKYETLRRERDAAVARADQLRDERDDAVQSCIAVGRERDEWKARAEKAEADRENIAEEFANFRVEVITEAVKYRESHPQASGDDPAVYVVRESDIAAVEIERDERGWHGPGTTWTERSTSGEVRAHAEGLVRNVARCEAVARAIEAEQAVDPTEAKARELYRVATPDARWETVADEYRRIAAHVLGQEAGSYA